MKNIILAITIILTLAFTMSAQPQQPQPKATAQPTPAPTPEAKKTIVFSEQQSSEVNRLQLLAANAQLIAQNTQLQIEAATRTLDEQRKAADAKRSEWLAAIQKASGLSADVLAAYELADDNGKLVLKLKEKQ